MTYFFLLMLWHRSTLYSGAPVATEPFRPRETPHSVQPDSYKDTKGR